MGLSDNIKYLRKAHRLTQNEFAQACGVTRGAVSNWETGKREPDRHTVIRISMLFKVDVEILYFEDLRTYTGKLKESPILKQTRKLAYIVPSVHSALVMTLIIFLLVILVPTYKEKHYQNENVIFSEENISKVYMKEENNFNTNIYQFKQINSGEKQYYLNDLEVVLYSSTNNSLNYSLTKFIVMIETTNGHHYELSKNCKLALLEKSLPILEISKNNHIVFTQCGIYDVYLSFTNNQGYIGAYLSE